MIGYLKGQIQSKTTERLILNVGNVGYELAVPFFELDRAKTGETKEYLVYTHVREDELSLFGFSSPADRQIFTHLISVSGIGPKLGIGIISQAGGAKKIVRAIQEADVEFFTSVKGLGKKGAQRLIVDLKSKLGGLKELEFDTEADYELVEALEGLGFSKKEIIGSIKGIKADLPLEEKLKLALKKSGSEK